MVREVPQKLPAAQTRASAPPPQSLGVAITNPDRVDLPRRQADQGRPRRLLCRVSTPLLATLGKRPMTLIRCPQGRAKHCFFQKHDSGSLGDAVKHVPIKEKDGGIGDYLYFDDAQGLLACVQMGTIEFHGWGSRIKPLEKPDRLVFDLDPDVGLDFAKVKEAALRLRDLLADLGLETFPLLSGGKGIHVVAPLDQTADLAQGQELRRALQPRHRRGRARTVHRQHPQEPAQGPHLPRLAAQPARRDRGHALFGARPRRRAGRRRRSRGRNWTSSTKRAPYTIRDADLLLERAGSKLLAGWGEAKQALPDV